MPSIASTGLAGTAVVREATHFAVLSTLGRFSATSPHHASLPQQRAKIFHPPAIDAQVAAPEPRCRAHRDKVLRRAQVQLEIIDKAKDSAAALGMKIIIGLRDDLGPRQTRHGRLHFWPSLSRR